MSCSDLPVAGFGERDGHADEGDSLQSAYAAS